MSFTIFIVEHCQQTSIYANIIGTSNLINRPWSREVRGLVAHNCHVMSAGPKEADLTANSNNKALVSVVAEDIRLVGGQNRFEGRVEVRVNGQWGAVCDDAWETNDAKVVCNALGMGQ